jgi:hypothetical protein
MLNRVEESWNASTPSGLCLSSLQFFQELQLVVSRPRFGCQVAWWWRGGGASQAELGTSAKGHLADRIFCIYKYQLATQLDSQ